MAAFERFFVSNKNFLRVIKKLLTLKIKITIMRDLLYIGQLLFQICLRDGKLRFVFRIHDFHKRIWCATNISLYFMDKEQMYNTEFEMVQMVIEPHGLLIFPLEIEHVIDENSPLWTFRPLDILQSRWAYRRLVELFLTSFCFRFEIVAVAEGSSNITGQVSQKRTSYSNSDIFWGQRFKPCVDYDELKQAYIVDYKKFKQTVPFDTPLCSAKKLQDIERRATVTEENIAGSSKEWKIIFSVIVWRL